MAMTDLADRGLVRWIGVSNFAAELIERCERIRHVDTLQPHLSMLWQERLSLLDICSRRAIGVIAYGALAFGLLTGTVTRQTRFLRTIGGVAAAACAPTTSCSPPNGWRSTSMSRMPSARSRGVSTSRLLSSRSRGCFTNLGLRARSRVHGRRSTCARTQQHLPCDCRQETWVRSKRSFRGGPKSYFHRPGG